MNTKHTMSDLREHLFDVIEKLKAPEPMDVQIAKMICLASQRRPYWACCSQAVLPASEQVWVDSETLADS